MKPRHFFFVATFAIALIGIKATTVVPPTFDQLVQQADVVFQGTVSDVRSVWEGQGAQRHIETYVTFQVAESLKNNAGSSYTMRMLGGTVGEDSLVITDAPNFHVGDQEILFVEHNYDQFVPLVGINHGRFHVQHDEEAGRDIVVNGEGAPVRDVTRLGQDESAAVGADVKEAISPDQLKAAIKNQLQVQAASAAQ